MKGPVKAACVSLGVLIAIGAAGCAEPDTRPPPKTSAAGVPAPPAWAAALIGQPLRGVFTQDALCIGATDMVEIRYGGAARGVQITGWGWDPTARQAVPRVVLVDEAYRIVAAADTGRGRPDVPHAHPEITSTRTGWAADVPLAEGVVATYGLLADGQTVCKLGGLRF